MEIQSIYGLSVSVPSKKSWLDTDGVLCRSHLSTLRLTPASVGHEFPEHLGWGCTGEPSVCVFTCGDGIVDPQEECDDDNLSDGDGCSGVCVEEPGYDCSGAPSVCFTIETNCGDGVDNNGDGQTDGMDENCQLPAYFPGCVPGEGLHVFRSEDPATPIPAGGDILMIPIQVSGVGIVSRAAMGVIITHPR